MLSRRVKCSHFFLPEQVEAELASADSRPAFTRWHIMFSERASVERFAVVPFCIFGNESALTQIRGC